MSVADYICGYAGDFRAQAPAWTGPWWRRPGMAPEEADYVLLLVIDAKAGLTDAVRGIAKTQVASTGGASTRAGAEQDRPDRPGRNYCR